MKQELMEGVSTLGTGGALYTKEKVMEKTTFSEATLWRKVKNGSFPSPVKLSARHHLWPAELVEGYLRQLTQEAIRATEHNVNNAGAAA